MPFLHSMEAPDAMKKMMRAVPPNFAFDVKSSNKPAKRSTRIREREAGQEAEAQMSTTLTLNAVLFWFVISIVVGLGYTLGSWLMNRVLRIVP